MGASWCRADVHVRGRLEPSASIVAAADTDCHDMPASSKPKASQILVWQKPDLEPDGEHPLHSIGQRPN